MTSIYKTQEKLEEILEVNTEYSVFLDDVSWVGIMIKTSRQEMVFLIDDFQACCERYAVELENLFKVDLIGSFLNDIRWTEDTTDEYISSFKLQIYTDRGVAAIYMYNQHNGYYPHSFKVVTTDYKNSGEL